MIVVIRPISTRLYIQGGPKSRPIRHYHESSLNRIKTRH